MRGNQTQLNQELNMGFKDAGHVAQHVHARAAQLGQWAQPEARDAAGAPR